MASLNRVRCEWTGSGVVGPAVTTFYFASTATGFSADLQTFFQAVKALITDDMTVTVPNTGDIIADSNGDLQGVWTDSGGSTTTGTNAGAYVAATGIRIKWVTGGIFHGRRVIGSTFLTGCVGGTFEADGTPQASSVSTVLTAASALIAAQTPDMVIWSRPSPKSAADGESNAVVGALVPDKATWLRSRRV